MCVTLANLMADSDAETNKRFISAGGVEVLVRVMLSYDTAPPELAEDVATLLAMCCQEGGTSQIVAAKGALKLLVNLALSDSKGAALAAVVALSSVAAESDDHAGELLLHQHLQQ